SPRAARYSRSSLWLALKLERLRSHDLPPRAAPGYRDWGEGGGSGHLVPSHGDLALQQATVGADGNPLTTLRLGPLHAIPSRDTAKLSQCEGKWPRSKHRQTRRQTAQSMRIP